MNRGRLLAPYSGNLLGRGISQPSYDPRQWLYVLALLCLVSLLAFLYLAQASYVTKQIGEMEALENELRKIKQDNNNLRLEIAEYEQMSRIKQQARALGLEEPQHVEYVEVVLGESTSLWGGKAVYDPVSSSSAASSHLPAWWHNAARQFRDWVSGSIVQAEQLDQ